MDNDDVPNTNDNCPRTYNPNQDDSDNDGVGDACDNCPNDPNAGQADCNSDGVGDACDEINPNTDDSDCDGVDDSCDSVADDDYVSTPTTCGNGVCSAAGEMACVAGSLMDTCVPGDPTGADDDCDGVDQDCSGIADDNYVSTPTTCGTGECLADGELICTSGALVDTCTPGPPTEELCDGLDNDCDGTVDNGGNALCDNGLFCDGAETCGGPNGCLPGTPPILDDGVDCTEDSCDEASQAIVHAPVDALCDDGLWCNGTETCDIFDDCQPGASPCEPPLTCNEETDECESACETIIRLEPAQVSGGCDTSQLTVAVVVAQATDLHKLNFAVTFDPSLIQVSGCTEGPFLGQAGTTAFGSTVDNALGRISIVNGLLGDGVGVSGCGAVALLTLDVVDWGALPAALCFEGIILEDVLENPICAAGECGAVTDPRKGDVDGTGYIDYIDLFDFVFEWGLTCDDEGYCLVKDYNDDCSIHYQDLFDFVFDWHSGAHLLSPDGGEVCSDVEEITWEAGATGTEALLVDLYVSTDGGACWHELAADEANDGSYMWDTTAWPDSSSCKLKINAHNSAETYEDESDGMFTIDNPGVYLLEK